MKNIRPKESISTSDHLFTSNSMFYFFLVYGYAINMCDCVAHTCKFHAFTYAG